MSEYMNLMAMLIGYTFMLAGGGLILISLLTITAWGTFEIIAKRWGATKLIYEWYREKQIAKIRET